MVGASDGNYLFSCSEVPLKIYIRESVDTPDHKCTSSAYLAIIACVCTCTHTLTSACTDKMHGSSFPSFPTFTNNPTPRISLLCLLIIIHFIAEAIGADICIFSDCPWALCMGQLICASENVPSEGWAVLGGGSCSPHWD